MELHLVRHGNDAVGYRGGWAQFGLTALGRRQASALAEWIQREGFSVDTLLASDLPRARETAEILAPALGLPLLLTPDWREANNGSLAGMPEPVVRQRYPGLFFGTLEMDQPYPGGGESPGSFQERVLKAMEYLFRQVQTGGIGPRVMVVTHGGVIRIITAMVASVPWSNRLKGFPASETSLHSFRLSRGHWEVVRQNCCDHLGLLEPAPADQIRPAFPSEGPLLSRLALWSKGSWGYDDAFLQACAADLTLRPAQVAGARVLEDEGRVLGFSLLEGEGPEAQLSFLFVAPTVKGTGCGRRLWEDAVAIARQRGYRAIRIDSDPYAEGFYRAMGARRVGEVESTVIPGRLLPLMRYEVGQGSCGGVIC